jgi:hypothetical protein
VARTHDIRQTSRVGIQLPQVPSRVSPFSPRRNLPLRALEKAPRITLLLPEHRIGDEVQLPRAHQNWRMVKGVTRKGMQMSRFRFGNTVYEYEGKAPDSSVAHNIAPLVAAELKNARADAQARQAALQKRQNANAMKNARLRLLSLRILNARTEK